MLNMRFIRAAAYCMQRPLYMKNRKEYANFLKENVKWMFQCDRGRTVMYLLSCAI